MRICIVQTLAKAGDISANLSNHEKLIRRAIKENVDFIVFPELSITGYEPTLAKELACNIDDLRFNIFQTLSDESNVNIGIGMPTITQGGINISMIVFRPFKERWIYSKQELHKDEIPYFVAGNNRSILTIKNRKVALGICYETLQKAHFETAVNNKADLFIASVSKPDHKINDARKFFSSISEELKLPILMSNSIGFCDDFLSTGKSAVWSRTGEVLGELDDKNQGLLVYDTDIENVEYSTKL